MSGLSEAGNKILQGTLFENYDDEIFPELKTFISQLAIPAQLQTIPQISAEITVEDYSKGIKKWRESTSTSPSGRHLGIYKALLPLESITKDMCEMLNVVTRAGLAPKRWTKAISVLLEKDCGQPNINRLRIIHLFEADYNLFLKIMWAQRLVARGEEYHLLGESQQGSRQGRTANDAVLLKKLTYDLSRILRSNLGTFDNDAKSCYDRIVNGIAMLAARRLGMPESVVAAHAATLRLMQYCIKTMYGLSDSYIQSQGDSILFGTGQGSGASPAIWLTISVVLLSSL
jgi:hypothetical protein